MSWLLRDERNMRQHRPPPEHHDPPLRAEVCGTCGGRGDVWSEQPMPDMNLYAVKKCSKCDGIGYWNGHAKWCNVFYFETIAGTLPCNCGEEEQHQPCPDCHYPFDETDWVLCPKHKESE